MNTIATFRKCTLTDEQLLQAVDKATDAMYETGEIPSRRIPAQPNGDYDLLVGELILRFKSASENILGYCVKCHSAILNMDSHIEIPEADGVGCAKCFE